MCAEKKTFKGLKKLILRGARGIRLSKAQSKLIHVEKGQNKRIGGGGIGKKKKPRLGKREQGKKFRGYGKTLSRD